MLQQCHNKVATKSQQCHNVAVWAQGGLGTSLREAAVSSMWSSISARRVRMRRHGHLFVVPSGGAALLTPEYTRGGGAPETTRWRAAAPQTPLHLRSWAKLGGTV